MASRQLLLAKKETTYGTSAAPAAIDAIWAEGVAFKINGDRLQADPARPTLAGVPGYTVGQHMEIEFDVQLSGSGTAGTAPKWGKLMKAAAFAETLVATTSVTYGAVADPTGGDSLTIVWQEKGRLHSITGARGKAGLKFTAGQQPKLHFLFRGLYSPVAAGALTGASADFSGWTEALIVAQGTTTFTFDSVPLGIRDMSVDSADNVKFTDLPNQRSVRLLGDRAFTGSIKATVPAVITDFNPETRWTANTKAVFAATIGTAPGSIVTINGRGQISSPPAYSDEDGDDVFTANLNLIGSSLGATDDLAIVLT